MSLLASGSLDRPGRLEDARRLDQILVDAPLKGLQAASLRLGQFVRERKQAHVGQNLAHTLEPVLELCGARRQDRGRVRRENALRVRQDLAPIHFVRDPVGRHKDYGVR